MTENTQSRTEFVERNAHWIGLAVIGLMLVILFARVNLGLPEFMNLYMDILITFLVYAVIVLGVNLQYGYTEVINFGPVLFFAMGGYATAILISEDPFYGVGLNLPWPTGIVGAIVAAGIMGLIIGLATLRLRDDFLAIVTLAAAEGFHDLTIGWRSLFGAKSGIGSVPRVFHEATSSYEMAIIMTFWFGVAGFLVMYAAITRLSYSPFGRVLRAIRADEVAATTLGKNVFQYKMLVFLYGSVLMGLAGFFYIIHTGTASSGFFTIDVTLVVWVGILLGGAGNYRAVVAGLGIIMGIQMFTRFFNDVIPYISQTQFNHIRLLTIGLIIVLVVRFKPAGIWGNAKQLGIND